MDGEERGFALARVLTWGRSSRNNIVDITRSGNREERRERGREPGVAGHLEAVGRGCRHRATAVSLPARSGWGQGTVVTTASPPAGSGRGEDAIAAAAEPPPPPLYRERESERDGEREVCGGGMCSGRGDKGGGVWGPLCLGLAQLDYICWFFFHPVKTIFIQVPGSYCKTNVQGPQKWTNFGIFGEKMIKFDKSDQIWTKLRWNMEVTYSLGPHRNGWNSSKFRPFI